MPASFRRARGRPGPASASPTWCAAPWSRSTASPSGELLLRRRIEDAVDLDDVAVEQPIGLEHGARRIGRLAPQFGLHLVDQGRDPRQVADIDGKPDTILQGGALRLGDQPDVEERLADARLVTLDQLA